MLTFKAEQLALIAAVVARVANDTQVRWTYEPHKAAFEEIGGALDTTISVYDIKKIRYAKIGFDLEIEVGPVPVAEIPDGPSPDPAPTTTGPAEAARLAA